jgi:hypothetical protein
MKTIRVFYVIIVAAMAVSLISCRSSKSKDGSVVISGKRPTSAHSSAKRLPPGQAKKLNGDKSAKAYAPGQQKKKAKKKG